MKKFTKDSYCDVRGWDAELIKRAAEMMAEDLGTTIWDDMDGLTVSPVRHFILSRQKEDVFVFGGEESSCVKTGNLVTKEEVEQMIKEREEAVIPLEKTGHGLGTISFPSGASIKFNADPREAMRSIEATNGMEENTLTRLHKAQEGLLQAEQNYTNAYEALNTAEKAHTTALEAFRKEAVGLLGESFKTPSARSQGYGRQFRVLPRMALTP